MSQRHAPRGPIKSKGDPMEVPNPMEGRCTAHNRKGARCGKHAIAGGTVCRMHGGAAPQVQEAAMARLFKLQHPAIDRLEQLMLQKEFPSTAYQAVRDVLDRTFGKPAESVSVDHSGDVTYRWKGDA